jgi:hypothetical protein
MSLKVFGVDSPWRAVARKLIRLKRTAASDHLRLRKHRYLDRKQTLGEYDFRRFSEFLVFVDYMMKLRAKMYQSGTSKFHLLMSEGFSIQVMAVK